MIKIVNHTGYSTKEMKALAGMVDRAFKKSFVYPPLRLVTMADGTDRNSWGGRYAGGGHIVLNLGKEVRFPNKWQIARSDEVLDLPTWEDWFVAMVSWCIMLHFQASTYDKKKKAGTKPGRKFIRKDAEEMSARLLKRWRVDSNLDLIKGKVDLDEI
jgi:hypothetical protein